MFVPSFSNMSIRTKLISVTVCLVLLPLLCVAFLSLFQFGRALRTASEEDLEHLVRNIYSMCKIQQEMFQGKVGAAGDATGAFDEGVPGPSARTLKDEIKAIKVGKTGYVYVIDSKGRLVIHPAKEGETVIDSKDSSGFQYNRAMIDGAIHLKPGDVGTIRYPWINPELGETKQRQKIHKYIYFKPWDWIITAGTFEKEIYQAFYETKRFVIVLVCISVISAFFLTVTLARVLTNPIHDLTEVTTKMVTGDLSQRVLIRGADEIGVLGSVFNRMIEQIERYTSDLQKMVDERTGELRESREEYREISRFLNSVLDSATAYAIMALDFYGNIIEFNRGAEKIFGWKKEEVINRENISITITPEDRGRDIQKDLSKKTRTEGVCDLEMKRVRKNGEIFPAHSTINAITDSSDRVIGFVEIIRDITKRKTLERELRETKEFLENIMESSVDGILTTDLKGRITYQNRAMEEIVQYPREEVLGTHISRFYRTGIQQARDIMQLLRESERAENYEMEVMGKSGEILSILTSLFLLRNEDGEAIGTAGIFKDISGQKRLEARLKAAQARLVEDSKMRALGELVAGVAHELNNPLMASQTILHVILKNLPKDSPEKERLGLIRKCNDRIERIVDHLREFSRQTRPEFLEINVNQPVENALMITGQQLLNHNITIEKNLTEGLPKVLGDPNQLEQVLLNLISNAKDALVDINGEKKLTFNSRRIEENGSIWVSVSVKDTGVGIPKEDLEKVFEPFFSTKPVGKGTGLGLSLCFGIIEAHNGRLEIRSEPGKGTEVSIFIPAKDSGKGF